MLIQDLLQQLHSLLLGHLMLYHIMEQEVHDREERADLLVREGVLPTVVVIDEVEIEHQLVHAIYFIRRVLHYCVQVEDLRQHLALIAICRRFTQIFCLVLVQRRVQEEVRHLQMLLVGADTPVSLLALSRLIHSAACFLAGTMPIN